MLPARHLCFDLVDDRVVPRLLTQADHPWLTVLLDEHARYKGRPWAELRRRMSEPLPCPSPQALRAAAWHVLERLGARHPPVQGVKPRELRLRVCLSAQRARSEGLRLERELVLATVAQELDLRPEAVDRGLFADHPDEQIVRLADPWPEATGLALLVNLALVQGILRRASEVRIRLRGNARAVVRQVQLRRLLCTVTIEEGHPDSCRLEISGAYALFRHTLMYGRRLASLLPVLQWCQRFQLEARCVLDGRERTLQLGTGAPIFPGEAPRRFDSKLEERFAKDFGKLAPGWDILREPAALRAGQALFFPDFELVSRAEPQRRWLLEIVGFWTPEYLERKLALLREAGRSDLLLCIDEELNLGGAAVPQGGPVLWFRKRVDAAAVLEVVERSAPASPRVGQVAAQCRQESLAPWDLFMDYAGRHPPEDPIHARLGGLRPGSMLRLAEREARLMLVDQAGAEVAVLSQRAGRRWRLRLGEIRGVVVERTVERTAAEVAPGYHHAIRCRRWLVPVVSIRW